MAPTAAPTSSPGDARFEAHGGALVNLLRSSGAVAGLVRQVMEAEALQVRTESGRPVVDDWFPLEKNLRILDTVARSFGGDALFKIGFSVPESAEFPPHIHDLLRALESIDVAFHMNHRRDGVVMYDPIAGHMLDGIGHYTCRRLEQGTRTIVGESTSVYPCEFDWGIYAGMAARFERSSRVTHDDRAPCRKNGENGKPSAVACRYLITW